MSASQPCIIIRLIRFISLMRFIRLTSPAGRVQKKSAPGSLLLSGAHGGGGDLLSRFRSIIGARGFNFSVRNGKRWSPPAVAALSRLCAVRLGGYGFRRAPAALWGLRLRMRRGCGRGGGVHEGSLGDARRACGGAASCARGRTLSEEGSRGRERAASRMHALPPLRRLSCLVSLSAPSPQREGAVGKGFGLLVSLGCRRRRPCTCDLSTSSSPTALQKWTSYL